MDTKEDMYQAVIDVIELTESAAWRAMDPHQQNQILIMEISEVTAEFLHALEPDEADEKLEELIEVAERIYDEYIAPIDLTGKPFIERIIDSKGREMIGPTIRKIYEMHNR